MNTAACLERIGIRSAPTVSYASLRRLQQSFLLSVPFENFDIHLGRKIRIDSHHVFRKIVQARRGGFCFESNALFYDLLKDLGFQVSIHGARMMRDGRLGPERGHMVLRVDLDRPYLVDVGNGKSFRDPLPFDDSIELTAEDFRYRFSGRDSAVLEKPPDGDWRPRFVYDPAPLEVQDFHEICEWTQTSVDSIFTRNAICTLALRTGRATLTNRTLTISGPDGAVESEVSPEEYADCLRTRFGLILPSLQL